MKTTAECYPQDKLYKGEPKEKDDYFWFIFFSDPVELPSMHSPWLPKNYFYIYSFFTWGAYIMVPNQKKNPSFFINDFFGLENKNSFSILNNLEGGGINK